MGHHGITGWSFFKGQVSNHIMLELGELSEMIWSIHPFLQKGDVPCQKSPDKLLPKEVWNQNSDLASLRWWRHESGLTCREMDKVEDANTPWHRVCAFTEREAERSRKRPLQEE